MKGVSNGLLRGQYGVNNKVVIKGLIWASDAVISDGQYTVRKGKGQVRDQ